MRERKMELKEFRKEFGDKLEMAVIDHNKKDGWERIETEEYGTVAIGWTDQIWKIGITVEFENRDRVYITDIIY